MRQATDCVSTAEITSGACETVGEASGLLCILRTLSPAAGAAGKLLVGNCWADAGQQRRLVGHSFFIPVTVDTQWMRLTDEILIVD